MKIGLYFGSFNPVHVAHLIIANHILNETDIEKIWFVVSPQNPFKVESNLLNEYHRLHLVRLATEEDNRIKASDIEFGLPKPSYTTSTLAYLAEKNPEHQFCIIMGSDSFESFGAKTVYGNNFSLSINAETKEEADKLFNALSAGGKILMPMENTFWNAYFGTFIDKFGVNWMVNYDLVQGK